MKEIDWNKRRYKKEDFIDAWENSETMLEVCKRLNFKGVSSNLYAILKETAFILGYEDIPGSSMKLSQEMFEKKRTSGSVLKKMMIEKESIPYVCSICNIDKWRGLEISLHVDHINGDPYDNSINNLRFLCPNCHSQTKTFGRGECDSNIIPTSPLNGIYKHPESYVFAKNTVYAKHLRKRIINECLLPYMCNECNVWEYNGTYLNLQVDHIDGDKSNNELDNLRFLCPNCHSQTDTYCGRNIDRSHVIVEIHTCQCGKKIEKRNTHCRDCYELYGRPSKTPNKDDFIKSIVRENGNITWIAKHYGVSGTTIKKWLKKYNLPYYSKDIKEFVKNFSD